MSNFYPAIPDPQNNTESLSETTRALKMAVETLSGQREGGAATRVFEQTDEPKDPRVGDTWVEKKDAGRIRLWNGSFWVDVSDSRFSVLEKSAANASAMIKELSLVRVTDTEAFAQKITELEAKFNENVASIYDELTVRATASEALAQRVTNLTATVNTTDYKITAAVSNEQVARVTADSAIATAVTTASVGAARVSVQGTAPTATGRLQGDVWYDTSQNYKPYYWNISGGVGSWVDNSAGTYKIGQVAAISESLTATQSKVDGTLGVQWAVQAIIDGATGGLKFTGLKKADGTGANYNFIIDANTTINGNVLINGTITVKGDGTSPIGSNAISASDVGFGDGLASVWVTANSASDVFLAVATYAGGDSAVGNSISKSLIIKKSGASISGAPGAPIIGFAVGGTGVSQANGTVVLVLNYQTAGVTTTVKVAAGAQASFPISINFTAETGGLAQPVSLYVVRLSR